LLQLCRGHRDGLPNFASPEQAAGLEIDSRSDFFSLGVLLWGMLANRPLYPASSREDWVKKLSEETPPSASQANPEAPNELDQILAKLLDRDMHMRYELGDRAVRDFEAVLSKYYPDFSAQDFAAFCDNHTLHFKKKYQAFLNARNEPQESTKALDFPTREESTFPSVEAPTATNLKEVSAPVPAPTIPNEAEEQEPIVLENAFEASYSPQGKFRVNVSMAPVEGPRPKIVDSNPLLSSTWLKVVLVCCMLTLLVIPFEGSNVLRHARSNRARSAASAPHGSLHILSKVQDYDLEINGKAFYVEDGSVNVPANIDLEVTAKKDGYEDFETITQVMPGEDLDLPIEFRKLISANAATPPAKVPPPPASSRINVGSKR
jgi:serine/threonine protein kinase